MPGERAAEPRHADVVPPCPICGFSMKWWMAKWKCFNCGGWSGCCGDETSDPSGLWCDAADERRKDETDGDISRNYDGSRMDGGA